jgi:hypothetical protein
MKNLEMFLAFLFNVKTAHENFRNKPNFYSLQAIFNSKLLLNQMKIRKNSDSD